MSQQTAAEYLSHGQTPFFRLPTAELSALPKGCQAAFVGVPYDGATTYQPGTRFAPYHVRRVSAVVQSFNPALGVDAFASLAAVDAGNIVFPPFDAAQVRGAIEIGIATIAKQGVVPFIIGGDHSIALPAMRALSGIHGSLAVVHVDAHLDTSDAEVWGDAYHHGTPFRHALTENLIADACLAQLGIRGAWGKRADDQPSRDAGALIVHAGAIHDRGVDAVMAEVRERLQGRPVYVSFDVDAVDPAYAPGTGTPVPGGISSDHALRIMRGLAGLNIVGVDLVEVAPALDRSDITSLLGAYLLFEAASALSKTRV